MKKKVKDLTLEELKKNCIKYENCYDCPLYDFDYYGVCEVTPFEYNEDTLNKEIEVEEDE